MYLESSRRSSVDSLSDLTADELAFRSVLKLSMLMRKKSSLTKQMRERKNGGSTEIIKLLLTKIGVSYEEFEKKCEITNTSKYWEFQDGIVVIFELPNRDHEYAHSAFSRQFEHQDPQSTVDSCRSASMYSHVRK
ncbi:unnamed protein product [Rhizophagus irregularis]|uniref:Uncharacterized protein n=1 Tax=Rhizophagus irregularis TaxID=588596 RepID=A0A915YQT1_9GLOM|nr:unnamed protein product [Rhizophagus irregularis]